MARIISGVPQQPEWDGGAILRGFKQGKASRLDEQQNAREQARLVFQIQKAIQDQALDERKLAAKEEELKHKRSLQMQGQQEQTKAGRLQSFAHKAEIGAVNPGQKMMERIVGARQRLSDPKALALFDDSVGQLVKSQQAAKKRKAFDEYVSRAEVDSDVFTPEMVLDYRQRADAGGNLDSLMGEMDSHRLKTSEMSLVRQENEQALQELQQFIDMAPEGYGKRRAKIFLDAAIKAKSKHGDEGFGQNVSRMAQEALLGPRSEYGQQKLDPYMDPKQRSAAYRQLYDETREVPTEDQIRERIRLINPAAPAPAPSGVKRTPVVDVHRVVTQAIQSGGTDKDILAAMRAAGIPITADNMQIASSVGRQYIDSARMQASEQRQIQKGGR